MKETFDMVTEKSFNSTLILGMRYFQEHQVLEIKFKGGRIFHYEGVPKRVWENAVKAESVGKFFHKEIKSKYEYKTIA